MTTWRITDIEPGSVYDAAEAIGTFGPGGLPEFVPVRDSSILADGDDETHVNLYYNPYPEDSLYGQVAPVGVPSGSEPTWLRLTVRWSVQGPDASQFLMIFGTYEGGDSPYVNGMIDGNRVRSSTRTAADGIVTDVGILHADGTSSGDLAIYQETGDILGAFRADGRTVWLSRFQHSLQENFSSTATHVRIHDVLFEVNPAVEFPLRQIQRDDHLAPGGTIRASTGTSRQGSIRARAYE